MTGHVQVTRPRRLHTILPSHWCLSPYRSATTYAYLLWLYLAHTSDHHSHRSLHNKTALCHWVPLASSFLSPFSLTASYLVPLSNMFSSSSPIFSYTASLSTTPPYAPLFPFLSISFPSHSYWLYRYILSGTYSSTYSSFVSLARNCLTTFPRSSECSSHSYCR